MVQSRRCISPTPPQERTQPGGPAQAGPSFIRPPSCSDSLQLRSVLANAGDPRILLVRRRFGLQQLRHGVAVALPEPLDAIERVSLARLLQAPEEIAVEGVTREPQVFGRAGGRSRE